MPTPPAFLLLHLAVGCSPCEPPVWSDGPADLRLEPEGRTTLDLAPLLRGDPASLAVDADPGVLARIEDAALVLVAAQPSVLKVLRITGLAAVLPIVADLDAAQTDVRITRAGS